VAPFILTKRCDVAVWHKTDQSGRSDDVRSWGRTGSGSTTIKLTRLTLAV
jgi:hypothetical protein